MIGVIRILAVAAAVPLAAFATSDGSAPSFLHDSQPFSRESMTAEGTSGFSLLDPARFSMAHSYSTSFTAGGGGTLSSGLLLSTLNYRILDPLQLSMDVGFYSPFHSTGAYAQALRTSPTANPMGEFVLPRISLEYRPTEHAYFSLHLLNMPDAARAYGWGFPGRGPFYH